MKEVGFLGEIWILHQQTTSARKCQSRDSSYVIIVQSGGGSLTTSDN